MSEEDVDEEKYLIRETEPVLSSIPLREKMIQRKRESNQLVCQQRRTKLNE